MWDLTTALIVTLIIFFVVYIAMRAYGVRGFSAVAVALLISLLILMATVNPKDMTIQQWASSAGQFYGFMIGLIMIILIIYILVMALRDRQPKVEKFSLMGPWLGPTDVQTVSVIRT